MMRRCQKWLGLGLGTKCTWALEGLKGAVNLEVKKDDRCNL